MADSQWLMDRTPNRLRWFYRRPLFWWALAAAAAVAIACVWQVPAAVWWAALLAGLLVCGLTQWEAGVALVLAAFFGIYAGTALTPRMDPPVRDGEAVTLRG